MLRSPLPPTNQPICWLCPARNYVTFTSKKELSMKLLFIVVTKERISKICMKIIATGIIHQSYYMMKTNFTKASQMGVILKQHFACKTFDNRVKKTSLTFGAHKNNTPVCLCVNFLYQVSLDWFLHPFPDMMTSHFLQLTSLLSSSVQYYKLLSGRILF